MERHLSRRQVTKAMGAGLTGLALSPVLAIPRSGPRAACPINAPLDDITARLLDQAPENATYYGVEESNGIKYRARRLNDYSPDGEARWRAALREAQGRIDAIACEAGDPQARLRLSIARAIIENGTRTEAIPYGHANPFWFTGHEPYLISQISGPHISSPNIMMVQQPVSSAIAVDGWLEKLDGFAVAFDHIIERLKADEASGCRPPLVVLQGALPVITGFLEGREEFHPLIASLRSRMASAGLDARLRASAETRAMTILARRARPAYARLQAQIADMLPRANHDVGIWAQPKGDLLYAANIRSVADSRLSAQAIHALGLGLVRSVTSRLNAELRLLGLTRGSIGERIATLGQRPGQSFPAGDEGREAIVDYLNAMVREMDAHLPAILPKSLIPAQSIEVRPFPSATQNAAPKGFYDGPSLDGTRPGIFWINLRDAQAMRRFALPTLAYHEAIPGHHLQSAIGMAQSQMPLLLRMASFNAFQEGWALYAEQLAAELGAYRHDRAAHIGWLQDDLFRSVRLVVDTGIHHMRWDRAHAIAYMRETMGNPMSEVVAEVDRYIAWPGQALGYKLGQLRLLQLRDRQRRALGKRFSLPTFHAAALAAGAMPFDLLDQQFAPPRRRKR